MPSASAVRAGDFDSFVFIVGAPRCGTTTLSRFLQNHPAISFPLVKEPHYFGREDLRALGDAELKARVEAEFLQRFYHSAPEGCVGADASPSYLYAPELLEPVLRLWPDSRFVVSLRDPLAMLPSLYQRLVYVGEETAATFADAWTSVSDRAAGRRIPRACADPRLLRYDEAGRFATYLDRLYSVVGKERCQVVIFDDLVADPAATYDRLMAFIGLEPQAGVDFSARRAGKAVRSRWLQRLLKRPPNVIRDRLGGELYRQRIRQLENDHQHQNGLAAGVLSMRKRLLEWNSIPRSPERLSPELQADISRSFRQEIDQLGRMLGRDLSHWLQPRESTEAQQKTRPVKLSYRSAFSQ
ncbi:MAG: sulfotransferase family protein [Sphingomicrobium sp.]